jgi:hypothetical protein
MRLHFSIAVLCTVTLLTFGRGSAFASGEVHVTMHDGRVSLSAKDATLREILDAWAVAGQTAIVNADGITSTAPLTLELVDMKEDDALAVLLRSLTGYLTILRPARSANVSSFERIVLLPTSVVEHDSTVTNTPAPAENTPPARPRPQQTVMINGVARLIGPNGTLVEDDQQDAPPPARMTVPPPPPVHAQPASPAPTAAVPIGSATPGAPVPAPPARNNTPAPTQR